MAERFDKMEDARETARYENDRLGSQIPTILVANTVCFSTNFQAIHWCPYKSHNPYDNEFWEQSLRSSW